MNTRRIFQASLATALVACSTATEPGGIQLGQTVTLDIGQSVTLLPSGDVLRFVRVAEDSRCPIDVTCVWMGNANVIISIKAAGSAAVEGEVNTHPDFARTAFIGRYTVTLESLEPIPVSTNKNPDYRAELTVGSSDD